MKPRIHQLKEQKLIGMSGIMSLSDNQTRALWHQFMLRRKEISNRSNDGLYSVQLYNDNFKFENFTPETVFEKWAAVSVRDHNHIPEGMKALTLAAGKYAVFLYKGSTKEFYKAAQYIFEEWLPNSGFELDNSAHFEIMGPNYLGPDNPNSEEEVWIPMK